MLSFFSLPVLCSYCVLLMTLKISLISRASVGHLMLFERFSTGVKARLWGRVIILILLCETSSGVCGVLVWDKV